MNSYDPPSSPSEPIEQAAATWVMRRDRGLTAAEQDELSQWLAEDPRHGEALALHRWGWDELDRLTGLQTSMRAVADPDLLAPRRHAERWMRSRLIWFAAPLVAAAAIVVMLHFGRSPAKPSASAEKPVAQIALAAPCERRELEDGSLVQLNRGAAVSVAFSAGERRVRVERGEAHFTVAKDPARPFIVSVDGLEVRAVGTMFNVRLAPTGVEVLVTEGVVKLNRAGDRAANSHPPSPLLLAAGDCTLVERDVPTAPHVTALSPAQIDARLAWKPMLLDFTDTPLVEIVAAFNRRNPVELVLTDTALGALKLSATFRSDNVEGFVRLMESDFGMRAEWRGERTIALARAK